MSQDSTDDRSWSWIEKGFKRIPVPYPIISIILFIFSYLIYIFLSKQVESFPDPQEWDVYTNMQIASACFLIAYETAGVRYYVDEMRSVFNKVKPVPENKKYLVQLNRGLEKRFTESKIFYIIVFLVIAPFIIIDPLRGEYHLYSLTEETITIWSILLDVFNYAITLLVLYSMATILWIIFNISWSLREIERSIPKNIVKIDLFNSDNVGGMKSMRGLILKLVVFQFIAISFGIISFVTPYEIIYHEVIFLIILFIVTVCFFIAGLYIIHKLLEVERGDRIDAINELYRQQNERMENIISSEDYLEKEKNLDRIIASMKFLQDESARVRHSSKRVYNFRAIFIFTSSSLIPFITTYLLPLVVPESEGYGQVIGRIEFFNQHILTLINDFLQLFFSLV